MKIKNDNTDDITGSGIICYFDNREGLIEDLDNKILYLVLKDFRNKYDFTKGTIDKGEEVFKCAIRETYEESNLDSFDFEKIYNPITINKNLVMFLGKIKHETMLQRNNIIKLKVNKHINSPEHKSYKFLSYEDILDIDLYLYLFPYLTEAQKILQ